MSGGSYDYAYAKLDEFASSLSLTGSCDAAPPALRAAFREHCRKVAEAMRACEWNDSCDGDSRERELIEAVLSKGSMADIPKMAKNELRKAAQAVLGLLGDE
jgi:hypothetical protein